MWRLIIVLLVACGHPRGGDDSTQNDGGGDPTGDGATGAVDAGDGTTADAHAVDAGGSDAATVAVDAMPDAPPGVITGGPCSSGSTGATAYRIRWANSNGTAYVVYEVHGLPDKSRNKAGAYGYQIGFKPAYVDPYLAQGGLRLDGSDFIDIELSTVGVSQIASATLSLYGRSFHTTASGSFNWQTFDGTGATPTNFVSNVAPYQWYSADMTSEISPGDDGVLIRIKAGPSSGVLVVNKVELCVQAS